MIAKAKYISIWDGGFRVETDCNFNTKTNEISNIEVCDETDSLETCDREYILLEDGQEIETENGIVRSQS